MEGVDMPGLTVYNPGATGAAQSTYVPSAFPDVDAPLICPLLQVRPHRRVQVRDG